MCELLKSFQEGSLASPSFACQKNMTDGGVDELRSSRKKILHRVKLQLSTHSQKIGLSVYLKYDLILLFQRLTPFSMT